jgi:hypothetical protein
MVLRDHPSLNNVAAAESLKLVLLGPEKTD